jgi:hypothetical protein
MRGCKYRKLLSRRRLVFSSEQVHVQCLEEPPCEMISARFSSHPRPIWQENPLPDDLQACPWDATISPSGITKRIGSFCYAKIEV